MTTNCHRFENIILELKEEKNIIQEQLKSGDDSARVLEEYKKRAQLALKKVIFREKCFLYEILLSRILTVLKNNRILFLFSNRLFL